MDHWFHPHNRFFFSTRLQPCPYIAGQLERKLVTDLAVPQPDELYEKLSLLGFRRSHGLAYRPDCPRCNACVPVRIDAREFKPGRTFRRIARRNLDLAVRETEALASRDQYELFLRYQQGRHGNGAMATMSYGQYRMMMEDTPVATRIVEFRYANGSLAAVMLMDRMQDALSAVYSFYDPETSGRSLGTCMILWMIRQSRILGLHYVYLGYWIEGSGKMSYKARFRPLEALGPEGWKPLRD